MKVTSKGQVTIPKEVRDSMGIRPAETEVEFLQDEKGRWYLKKTAKKKSDESRFRRAHKVGKLKMNTEQIMALMRDNS